MGEYCSKVRREEERGMKYLVTFCPLRWGRVGHSTHLVGFLVLCLDIQAGK